jgi:hypothetical protein
MELDRRGAELLFQVLTEREDAMGVSGVGQRDADGGHRGQDAGECGDGVVAAGGRGGAAGELGDGRALLVRHHYPGGPVIAEEQLVLAAQQVVLAVAPGRLGVGAGSAPGVHRQRPAGVLELLRGRTPPAGRRRRPPGRRRGARPARPCRGRPRPGRRCARSAGRSAGAGRAPSPRARPAAAGHRRAG